MKELGFWVFVALGSVASILYCLPLLWTGSDRIADWFARRFPRLFEAGPSLMLWGIGFLAVAALFAMLLMGS